MLNDLIERAKAHDVAEMAFKTGVSVYTIRNILSGRHENPTLNTIMALQDFCDQKDYEKETEEK